MNFYFDSRNIPVPNRMNWKDAETDECSIPPGRGAERRRPGQEFRQGPGEGHEGAPVDAGDERRMYQTTNKKIKACRAHMLFQNTFYKGLDLSL
jgi:peptide/nickel transport system substrate-binding protein